MRQPRIKVDPAQAAAIYHCMSRTVNGEWLFDEPAREVLRRQIQLVAEYTGLTVRTYAILSNHFHVLVKVPVKGPISDEELLRRYSLLHPKPTRYQTARLEVIKQQLTENGPEAMQWRQRQLRLMGDVSSFMKLLKQRFTIWFNKTHRRYGTIWSERFKSVLIEPENIVALAVAAYIDLNAVRAGMVQDPKDYRFCGYGEAVAGGKAARLGLQEVTGQEDWDRAQADYRVRLFGAGADVRERSDAISIDEMRKVFAEGGKLPMATVLRCRLRYFTDGAVLGTKAFVQEQLTAYQRRHGRREGKEPVPLPPVTDWGGVTALRGLRRAAFG